MYFILNGGVIMFSKYIDYKDKYFRFKCGEILQLTHTKDVERNMEFWGDDLIIADTPQELVQVGDLVKADSEIHKMLYGNSDMMFVEELLLMAIKLDTSFITAIYTKDSNGNYIKQWSDE